MLFSRVGRPWPNKALQPTTQPLRGFASAELVVRVMEAEGRVARRSQEGVYSSYSRSQALQTRIQKWGNSLGVRIPRSLADEVGVGPGSEVSLSVLEGELIVKPAFPARFKLEDLLAGITPENLHSAVDTGEPVGVEIL